MGLKKKKKKKKEEKKIKKSEKKGLEKPVRIYSMEIFNEHPKSIFL